MMDKQYEPVNLFWYLVGFAFLMMITLARPAEAGPSAEAEANSKSVSKALGGNSSAENNLTMGGDSSKAYGFGMGDVDINQCLYSWQVLFVQGVKLNLWCAADAYDAAGQHDNAARTRCRIKGIKESYDSKQDCIDGETREPVEAEEPSASIPDLGNLYVQAARYDEHEDEYASKLDRVEKELASLKKRKQPSNNKAALDRLRRDQESAQIALQELESYK